MDYKEQYKYWCEDAYFDEETKKELQSIASDDAAIQDRQDEGRNLSVQVGMCYFF